MYNLCGKSAIIIIIFYRVISVTYLNFIAAYIEQATSMKSL